MESVSSRFCFSDCGALRDPTRRAFSAASIRFESSVAEYVRRRAPGLVPEEVPPVATSRNREQPLGISVKDFLEDRLFNREP